MHHLFILYPPSHFREQQIMPHAIEEALDRLPTTSTDIPNK